MMNIQFQPAARKRAKAKLALIGPAGAGKTHSALLIAKGLAENAGKIAVIDTENSSAELEVGKPGIPEFDVLVMHAPFDPAKYIAAIKEAENDGYEVIIIDSLSHAWAGSGGLLEKKDVIASAAGRNSYTAWREVSPLHNKLVETIIQSSSHIIATMRSKTEYAVEQDEKGKTVVKKIGLAPIQRDGIEYEFTLVLDVDQKNHVASSSKDRTSLFDGQYFVPSEETGRALRLWLSSGTQKVSSGNGEDKTEPSTQQSQSEKPSKLHGKPNGRFLKVMKEMKDKLGEKGYHEKLQSFGYKDASEIPNDRELQTAIYKALQDSNVAQPTVVAVQ
jgi:hypothetical protein